MFIYTYLRIIYKIIHIYIILKKIFFNRETMDSKDVINSILENNTEEKDTRTTIVNKDIEVETDLGTLLALDYNSLDLKAIK